MILDLNGILFAVQLACLLILGPYADYGTWRPWLLIGQSPTYRRDRGQSQLSLMFGQSSLSS